MLSDEEAQEVARLLGPKDKPKWQSDIANSSIPESISGPNSMLLDSSGPVSLNDSLGPPSLQEESVSEPEPIAEALLANNAETVAKEPVQSFPMYESNSSMDISRDLDDTSNSKMDTSVSTCDSGLIGKNWSYKNFNGFHLLHFVNCINSSSCSLTLHISFLTTFTAYLNV